MIRVPSNRTPAHPGEMLQEEFLIPMGLTQRALADAIHVPYQRVNDLVNGRRGITSSTALRLARFFGNSAGFWMIFSFVGIYTLPSRKKKRRLKRSSPIPTNDCW